MPTGTRALRYLVKISGLTQREFAARRLRHVGYRTLKRYLAGGVMPPRVLEQVAALAAKQRRKNGAR